PGETRAIKEAAAKSGATLYMVLLAVYNILLSKYTGQDDIIVGTPVAGRRHADLEDIMGMFVNVLLMRNQPKPDISFATYLKGVIHNTIQAFENQDYPFDALVEKLNLESGSRSNPLYDVVFAVINVEYPDLELPGMKLEPFDLEGNTSKTDLRLGAVEMNGGIEMKLTYATTLFKSETAEEMANHYGEILKQVLGNPQIKLKDIVISHRLTTLQPHELRDNRETFNF
ncbi:MAG: hypothetical protein GY950_16560, partial [bacterium]|nr:hypothetical protein [bacterium]